MSKLAEATTIPIIMQVFCSIAHLLRSLVGSVKSSWAGSYFRWFIQASASKTASISIIRVVMLEMYLVSEMLGCLKHLTWLSAREGESFKT